MFKKLQEMFKGGSNSIEEKESKTTETNTESVDSVTPRVTETKEESKPKMLKPYILETRDSEDYIEYDHDIVLYYQILHRHILSLTKKLEEDKLRIEENKQLLQTTYGNLLKYGHTATLRVMKDSKKEIWLPYPGNVKVEQPAKDTNLPVENNFTIDASKQEGIEFINKFQELQLAMDELIASRK